MTVLTEDAFVRRMQGHRQAWFLRDDYRAMRRRGITLVVEEDSP